mmetsp:Transcript_54400/g.140542  ORF Transcript_54400/g.140542 Transcript_54400/m.140542 type:complete len:1111 (-) Transcript_54400:87-3419(-)
MQIVSHTRHSVGSKSYQSNNRFRGQFRQPLTGETSQRLAHEPGAQTHRLGLPGHRRRCARRTAHRLWREETERRPAPRSGELRDLDLLLGAALLVRLLERLLGAKDGDLEGLGTERRRERGEGGAVGGEHLVAEALAHLVGDARQVERERTEALRFRRQRRVEVADGADDGLLEGVVGELEVVERIRGLGVDVERPLDVGVAVRREGEGARARVERAAAAVGAADDAHVVPEVRAREEARDGVEGAVELRARLEELGACGHVVHLRRDRVALVRVGQKLDGVTPRGRVGRHGGRRGQLRCEGVHHRPHVGEGVGVGREVDDEPLAAEERVAHLLQPAEQRRPIVLGLREHGLHLAVVRDALREFADVAVEGGACAEAGAREGVARRDEGGLEARLRLAQQLDDLRLPSLERRVGEQRVGQLEQVVGLLDGGLAADGEVADEGEWVGHGAAQPGGLLVEDRGAQAARARADAPLQRDGVHLRRADFVEELREDARDGQLLEWQLGEVEQDVGVHDARARQAVREQLAAALERLGDRRERLDLPLEIRDADARDRLEVFFRVLAELRGLQGLGVGDDLLEVRVGHLRLHRRELRLLRRLLRRRERLVRHELERRAVVVVDEHLEQRVLKHLLPRGEALLEARERRLEAQRVRRRAAAVQPARHHVQHQREALREAARVELAQGELDRVQAGLDGVGVEAVGGGLLERREGELLDLGHVVRLHALQAHREGRLLQLVRQPAAHERRAEARLAHRLVERRRGRPHQQVVEDAEGELLVGGEVLLVQQPRQHHHVLRRRAGLHRELFDRAARLLDERLRRDGRRGRRGVGGVEVAQVGVEEVEARGQVVVAVEEDARVRRVVVRVVEGLELLERQRRDGGRVSAGVDRVRVVGEGELLGGAVHERVGRGVDALHLVEHHALVRQRLGLVLELVVPALLREHRRVALRARVQHGVQVDVDEVVEVLGVLRGDRVARAVGVRERVQERLQRSLEQLDERLLARVLVGAAEDRVLENVRHARRVGHGRAEDDAEDLVVIVRLRRDQLGARLLVPVGGALDGVLVDHLDVHQLECRVRRRLCRHDGRDALAHGRRLRGDMARTTRRIAKRARRGKAGEG